MSRFARFSLIAAIAVALPLSAAATPQLYNMLSGSKIQKMRVSDASDPAGSPCRIGVWWANCLVNAPLAIDSGSVVIDFASGQIHDLQFQVNATGILRLGGYAGIDQISFSLSSFQSSGSAAVSNITTALYDMAPTQGTFASSLVVDWSDGSRTSYQSLAQTALTGLVFNDGTNMQLILDSVNIGSIFDSVLGKTLEFQADFSLYATPAIPEPSAAAVFGIGLLGVLAASRRRTTR